MMKRVLGAGCVAMMAFAAACTTETGSTEPTEVVGKTAQALTCSGSVASFAGNFTTDCSTRPLTESVNPYDLKLLHLRAQAYFAYIMGGPVPPTGGISIGGTNYGPIRDSFWSDSNRNTGGKLCAIRNSLASTHTNHVEMENTGDTENICGYTPAVYHLGGEVYPTDANGCNWTTANIRGVGNLIAEIGRNGLADRGWCVQDNVASGLPSFIDVAWLSAYEALIDPEPVTLNAGQTLPAVGSYSSSTNAAATGDETGAAYAQATANQYGGGVFRWPSGETYAASTTQLASQVAAKTLGVPCFTTDQTGSTTKKFIKRGLLANKYLCVEPPPP